jgi:two-component system, LuxR family, response regulator FixJ
MSVDSAGTVFIVDDDVAVRDSLSLLLGLRGFKTRSFGRGEDFLAAVDPAACGCVLLDLRMPSVDGIEVQAALAARGIALPIIILTAHGDVASARTTLKGGAFDFLEKPVDDALLSATIEAALGRDASVRVHSERADALRRRVARLTPRERQVLAAVIAGRHNREIAADLRISPRTVEVYKARLMDKLQIDRLPELIRLALEFGLMDDLALRDPRKA